MAVKIHLPIISRKARAPSAEAENLKPPAEDDGIDPMTVISLVGATAGGLAIIIFLLDKFVLEKGRVDSYPSDDEKEVLEEDALAEAATAGMLGKAKRGYIPKERSLSYLDGSAAKLEQVPLFEENKRLWGKLIKQIVEEDLEDLED